MSAYQEYLLALRKYENTKFMLVTNQESLVTLRSQLAANPQNEFVKGLVMNASIAVENASNLLPIARQELANAHINFVKSCSVEKSNLQYTFRFMGSRRVYPNQSFAYTPEQTHRYSVTRHLRRGEDGMLYGKPLLGGDLDMFLPYGKE